MFASLHSFFTEQYIAIGVVYFLLNLYFSVRGLIKYPLTTKSTKKLLGKFWYYTSYVVIWSLNLLIAVTPIWSGYFLIITIVSYFATVKKLNFAEKLFQNA